jgi:hypothetical protein
MKLKYFLYVYSYLTSSYESLFQFQISYTHQKRHELDDGRTCRIPVRKGDGEWEWKINGVSEYDCFEQIPYAG